MRTTPLLLCVVAACGGNTPATDTPKPKPIDAGVEAQVEDPPAPDATPMTPEERIAAALARVPAIREKVSELRHLPSTEVPAAVQTLADFEVFVRKEAAEEMPVDEAANESRALAHLGVLEAPVDLIEVNIDAAVSQVAAYYDPDAKHFQVVQVPEDDQSFDMVSAHELTHAVADQNFDLKAFMPPDLTDDGGNARRYLVEGEATLVMLEYLQNLDLADAAGLEMLRKELDMFGGMDMKDLSAMTGNANPSAAAAAALPPSIITPMFNSYFGGANAVIRAYVHGGWAEVDNLYKHPPTTTEQMLHPAAKLVCFREEPVLVSLPASTAGKGWKPVADGVLGELGIQIYGDVWKLDDKKKFADGWNGDVWRVVEKNGAMLGLMATAWDTEADAKEFADGMEASFLTRSVDGQVAIEGDRVDVVIGCKDKACRAPLAALAKLHAKAKPEPAHTPTQAETDCLKSL